MKKYFPLLLIFLVITCVLVALRDRLLTTGLNVNFVLTANLVLFLITLLGYVIVSGNTSSSGAHAFMRGVYTSFLLKLLIITGALFIFISASGSDINRPAIFVSMGLYIIYSAVEVIQLMKRVRNQKNE